MYENGDGVARDPAEASRCYRRMADLGYPPGQWKTGLRYASGEGVEKDPAEALKWHRKAADQGYAYAEFAVGQMYENGLGVAKDDIEALAWYNLSPKSGGSDETNHRDRLERVLGPEAAQQARRRADELRKEIQARNPPPAN